MSMVTIITLSGYALTTIGLIGVYKVSKKLK